jgi:rhodanese-related sulfurtransferase
MTLNGVLSCPWVVLRAVGGSCGELLGVKAGDGGACHCDGLRWLAGGLDQWKRINCKWEPISRTA